MNKYAAMVAFFNGSLPWKQLDQATKDYIHAHALGYYQNNKQFFGWYTGGKPQQAGDLIWGARQHWYFPNNQDDGSDSGDANGTPTPTPTPAPAGTPSNTAPDTTALMSALKLFLDSNGLPMSLLTFIQNEIIANKPFDEIVWDLRQTPEYQAAYPENAVRQANGYDWMSEADIRGYRSTARQIAVNYLGYNPTTTEIAGLLENNVSLSEWSQRIATYKDFQKYGPVVNGILSQELGHDVSDERVFAFLDPEISTPELDRAYTYALLRGQPAQLGIGIRPEEEANILTQYGIDPSKAFAGYQAVASELPAAERFNLIEQHINQLPEKFPDAQTLFQDTPFGLLFRAIQLQDPAALQTLSEQMAREVARFQAGGGPVGSGTALTGIVPRGEQ